jgi:hypothetical protein
MHGVPVSEVANDRNPRGSNMKVFRVHHVRVSTGTVQMYYITLTYDISYAAYRTIRMHGCTLMLVHINTLCVNVRARPLLCDN